MGQVPTRDEERDRALISDYKAGIYETHELVTKYGISSTRIYQILDYYEVRRGQVKKGQAHGKNKGK